ncbi:MAG TPA: S41 family peptidase [Gemmatimonadaceae bacterium]|nr:S41 family peptidase [Gemmatimonadaceae bacterium]
MRRPRKLAAFAVVSLPLLAGAFLLQSRARDGSVLLDQVLSLVSERFVDTLPQGAMYEKAARGLVRELNDPYTELLSPKELKQFTTRTGGRYGGLGMQIEPRDQQIVVSRVFPHTPAERNGVREGDRIVQVDTSSTRGWSTQQASDILTGTPGTKVRVKFSRPAVAQPIEMEFTRAVIHIPAVPYAITFGNVGYVPLQSFNENAASEVEEAVRGLVARGAKGVILDVRGNPGGILEQSLTVSNLFLRPGLEIASVRARSGETQSYVARGQPALPTTPLIVLADERAASASEIVTGALQDHDRAVIVGQTTFGKGLVQSVFNLDGGYALKMTTAKWFTPSGRSIQKERKFVDGQFVEDTTVDSLETETTKKSRPAYKSDAGRVVYGGGGITPDVIVPDDTLSAQEQALLKALSPKAQEFSTALQDYALELSRQLQPDFQAQAAWRDELRRRLESRGVKVDPQQWQGGERWIGQQIEYYVARYVAGDSSAKRRQLPIDAPLRRAIDMMNRGQSQKDLFNLAQAMVPLSDPRASKTQAAARP